MFQYDNSFLAAHGWESPYGPSLCAQADTLSVITCNQGIDNTATTNPGSTTPYDSERVWLTHLLGPLNAKNEGTLQGELLSSGQDQFGLGGSAAAISMDSTGYLYAPKDCAAGASCGLLLALHGCSMSYSQIGPVFINDAGLNQLAETNHLIVLYPQTLPSSLTGGNRLGCWDWWGYQNDPDYAQKSGPQMQALFALVTRTMSGSHL